MAAGIFARIVAGEIPSHEVASSPLSYAFLDIQPLRPGHTLVIPRREVAQLQDLSSEEVADLFELVRSVRTRQRDALGVADATVFIHDGAQAGQEVPHVHVHVVPCTRGAHQAVHVGLGGPQSANHDALADLAKELRNR